VKPGRGHQHGGPWLDPYTKADKRIDRKQKRITRKREAHREIKDSGQTGQ
jgi:hypothetical protein